MLHRPIAFLLTTLLASGILPSLVPQVGMAQYMFLDANGDGETSGYQEWAAGDTVTVDLYIVTDKTRDGSFSSCESGDGPLDLMGYAVNIESFFGPFEVLSLENRIAGMAELFPPRISPYGIAAAFASATPIQSGKHHLLRMRVLFGDGGRNMELVSASCFSPPGVETSLVTSCAGLDGDNTMNLDGFGFGYATDPPNRRPIVTAPDEVSGVEGATLSLAVTVIDPECGSYPFSFWVYGLPSGASFSGLGAFGPEGATGTLSWTPTVGQAGAYSVKFEASDPDAFNWWIDPFVSDTTNITISPKPTLSADAVPIAHAGGPYAAELGSPIEFRGSGTSSDPEGGALAFGWAFGDGAVDVGPAVAHAFAERGVYDVTLTVTDERGLTGQDHATATITARRESLIASIAPNPITAKSVMEFTTSREGFVSVRLFDARGRLIGTVFESAMLGTGTHRINAIGTRGPGLPLASGVYFLRVVTEHDSDETRRILILR